MKMMVRYWTNFVRTGNPNLHQAGEEGGAMEGATEWPAYTLSTQENIVFQVFNISTTAMLRAEYCAFWDAYSPRFGSGSDLAERREWRGGEESRGRT